MMRWGPWEKGGRQGPRAQGEGGQGCEDGGDTGSSKRVGNSIQSTDHGIRGGVVWRAGQSAETGTPLPRREEPLHYSAFYSLSFTIYSASTVNTSCMLVTVLDTGDTKHGKIQHGPVGSHSKARPPSSSGGRHRYPHLPQVQIEVQRGSGLTGSHTARRWQHSGPYQAS